MSNEIKRYGRQSFEGNMVQRADGQYVLHSDHEAEVTRLRAMAQEQGVRDGNEIGRLRAEVQNAAKAALDATALACEKEREADALRDEVEEYKSLVRGIVDNRHKCFIPTDDPSSPTFNWDDRADAAMGEGK